ncbi:MAG: hypothetical protein RLZ98_834 [Pseudomonadota bacterium]|jgi:aromatic ring-opening dioxygenase LigB subunit
MSIVFACAGSHAPGVTAWTEAAAKEQVDAIHGGYAQMKQKLAAANVDTLVLLTSEHWCNYFLDHMGAFSIGLADHYEGPVEPWLKVEKHRLNGDPELAKAILENAYRHDFEPNFAHEMMLDHGTMVPIHFLLPRPDMSIVPIMFNTLAPPRPSPARCLAFGKAIGEVLAKSAKRIGIVATGGLSHDPGEVGHGIIDLEFDRNFLQAIEAGNLERLASYSDGDLAAAGGGTLELLAWIALAGALGGAKARTVAYEPVVEWATGMGIVEFDLAA